MKFITMLPLALALFGCANHGDCERLSRAFLSLEKAKTEQEETSAIDRIRTLPKPRHNGCGFRIRFANDQGEVVTSEQFYEQGVPKYRTLVFVVSYKGDSRSFARQFLSRDALKFMLMPK